MSIHRKLTSAVRRGYLRRSLIGLGCILLLVQIEGCYYMQAASGQMSLMNKRRPIDDVIDDEASPQDLKNRLAMVRDARRFSVDVLLLPDNKSYQSYADLERDYVVWNVFAAPEFSLTPKQWCFPVAGCVAYRGYFSEESARKHADKLHRQGFDTTVGGVAAYSTLGKFSDPVLNTMMRWSDADLVATLFHELAHQELYVKDDTMFNESFATAVSDIGIEKWLEQVGQTAELDTRRERAELRRDLMTLVDRSKSELSELYSSGIDETDMRQQKETILKNLVEEIEQAGGTGWLSEPLNNSRLASLGLYESYVPAFRVMFDECERDMRCFYDRAEALSALDASERKAQLENLGQTRQALNAPLTP